MRTSKKTIVKTIILALFAVVATVAIITVFAIPVSYDMYYSEYDDDQEYNVNNVEFSSGMRDYQNIAFVPNRKGFRAGCFWLKAFMDTYHDVTVNSYDTYFVYKDKAVLASKTDQKQNMVFQKLANTTPHYESSGDASEIFYIPDSELKKINGVRIIANVTVSDDAGSITENIEFEYKTDYKGISMFYAFLLGV